MREITNSLILENFISNTKLVKHNMKLTLQRICKLSFELQPSCRGGGICNILITESLLCSLFLLNLVFYRTNHVIVGTSKLLTLLVRPCAQPQSLPLGED